MRFLLEERPGRGALRAPSDLKVGSRHFVLHKPTEKSRFLFLDDTLTCASGVSAYVSLHACSVSLRRL